MTEIRIQSVGEPFDDRQAARLGVEVLTRAEAMGLLGRGTVLRLDAEVWRDALGWIRRAGVGRHLAQLNPESDGGDRDEFARQLTRLGEALEASPVPSSEGPKLDGLLGRDLLARLLRISGISLRRYLAGERVMPDDVAARLHFLALATGDLSGAYNEIGVRRWFDRPRKLLDGRTPADLLLPGWRPEDAEPRRVRDLAQSLVWSPAT